MRRRWLAACLTLLLVPAAGARAAGLPAGPGLLPAPWPAPGPLPAPSLPAGTEAPSLPPGAATWPGPGSQAPRVLEGTVAQSWLEGPHMELVTPTGDRYALLPAPGVDLTPWVGQQVRVEGSLFQGPTIYQMQVLVVHRVAALPAARPGDGGRPGGGETPGPGDAPVRLPEVQPGPAPTPPAPPTPNGAPVTILPVPGEGAAAPVPKEPRRVAAQPWPPAATGLEVSVRVVVRGVDLPLHVPPLLVAGRTLVPVRAVAEHLGVRVEWDGSTRTVTVRTPRRTVRFRVEDARVAVTRDGTEATVTLDVVPILAGDRLLVPLRALAEALGFAVTWDGETRTVHVDGGEE